MVIFLSCPYDLAGFDDFRHGHAQPVFHQHDFAARHQPVVHIDVDGFADLAVELDDGALAQLEQLADFHRAFAQHGGDRDRHVEHGFQVGGRMLRRGFGRAVAVQQRSLNACCGRHG